MLADPPPPPTYRMVRPLLCLRNFDSTLIQQVHLKKWTSELNRIGTTHGSSVIPLNVSSHPLTEHPNTDYGLLLRRRGPLQLIRMHRNDVS